MRTAKQLKSILSGNDRNDLESRIGLDELNRELWQIQGNEAERALKEEMRWQGYYDRKLDRDGVPPITQEIFEESYWGSPF